MCDSAHSFKVEFHLRSYCNSSLQTILSAFWQGCKLGLSFYEVESASLHFMADSAEWEDFQLMSRGTHSWTSTHCCIGSYHTSPQLLEGLCCPPLLAVLWQVSPHTVVLSSKQDERLREAVKVYSRWSAVWCGVVQCGAVHYGVVGCSRWGAVWCGGVQCGAVRYGVVGCSRWGAVGGVQCGGVQCGVVRYGVVGCSVVQCATVWWGAV